MNWVDLVMLAVVGLSAMAGLLRGFARELLGLVAWVAAALLASHFYAKGLPLAHRWIEDGLVADIVCFTLVFVIILIGLSVLASLLSRLVRLSLFGGVDRILGHGFGNVRGGALRILAYIVLAFVLPLNDWPTPLRRAHGLTYLHEGAQYALTQAPERWRPLLPSIGADAAPAAGKESF
jgi:membrane protein required for colicin V production